MVYSTLCWVAPHAQRAAMDDLAPRDVDERSKLRYVARIAINFIRSAQSSNAHGAPWWVCLFQTHCAHAMHGGK